MLLFRFETRSLYRWNSHHHWRGCFVTSWLSSQRGWGRFRPRTLMPTSILVKEREPNVTCPCKKSRQPRWLSVRAWSDPKQPLWSHSSVYSNRVDWQCNQKKPPAGFIYRGDKFGIYGEDAIIVAYCQHYAPLVGQGVGIEAMLVKLYYVYITVMNFYIVDTVTRLIAKCCNLSFQWTLGQVRRQSVPNTAIVLICAFDAQSA